MNHRAVVIPLALSVLALAGCGGAGSPAVSRTEPAQRLADAGACFGEHDIGRQIVLPRLEGGGAGAGVVGLLRPRLRPLAQHFAQPTAGRLDRHRL